MSQLDKHFSEKLNQLGEANRLRVICNYSSNLIDFSSNDYLGLKKNKKIMEAAKASIDKYGTGSGSSRLVTGNFKLYDDLEELISKYHGKDSACVFSSGYSANISTIPCLADKEDLIIADKLCHSCIIEGAKLSQAKFIRFKHNNFEELINILELNRHKYKKCMIVSEAVFSMDGDKCNVKELNNIAANYDAFTYIDYAHEINPENERPDIVMGTFSKAYASLGGYVCASKNIVNYIKTSAKSLIYSTALPPSVIASSIEALKMSKATPILTKKALDNARYFCELMNMNEPESQMVPIIIGEEAKTIALKHRLEDSGFIVAAIRPPTVPPKTSRLRLSFSASHDKQQIEEFAKILKELINE